MWPRWCWKISLKAVFSYIRIHRLSKVVPWYIYAKCRRKKRIISKHVLEVQRCRQSVLVRSVSMPVSSENKGHRSRLTSYFTERCCFRSCSFLTFVSGYDSFSYWANYNTVERLKFLMNVLHGIAIFWCLQLFIYSFLSFLYSQLFFFHSG